MYSNVQMLFMEMEANGESKWLHTESNVNLVGGKHNIVYKP